MSVDLVQRAKNPRSRVRIALVGKYVTYEDSYKSLNEALVHGGIDNNCKELLTHIDAEDVEKDGRKVVYGFCHGR